SFADAPNFGDQPQDVGLAVGARAAVGAVDLAQPPFQLAAAIEAGAVAETIGAGDGSLIGDHVAGSIAGGAFAVFHPRTISPRRAETNNSSRGHVAGNIRSLMSRHVPMDPRLESREPRLLGR